MPLILTVDDSPSIRQMIKLVVGPVGYVVVEAGDGSEGLAKAKSQSIDLVITDLNMTIMNGMQMIKGLRAPPTFTGVPIVIFTTESDEAVKREAKAAGQTGWITKPFRPERLLAIVAKLVRA